MRDRIVGLRYVRAGDLIANPKNWRKHPAAQRQAMATVLDRIGMAAAVVARKTDAGLELVDGHLRADLDPEAILPVLEVDLDEDEALQVLATMDPIGAMAEADLDGLSSLLDQLDEMPPLQIDFGSLYGLGEEREPTSPDDSTVAPPQVAVSRPGDVWALGGHRLMCGDAMSHEHVEQLIGSARPRLLITDPPYGVNHDPTWRTGLPTQRFGPNREGLVDNDDSTDWSGALRAYEGAEVAYIWSPGGPHQLAFAQQLVGAGFDIRFQIIWAKQKAVFSRGAYHWQHEPCWYAVRKGATAKWIGGRKQSTVWEIANLNPMGGSKDPDDQVTRHTTQKPVECMERPLRNHEGNVYDPFVGTGTTIIAAERQGRRCWAMEINPHYVDVAVLRWQKATGEAAVREGDGLTYDQLQAEMAPVG